MEKLAEIEHQRWSDWQRYVHSNLKYCEYQKNGKTYSAYFLDPSFFERWEKQIDQSYLELSEEEKEKDREQVRRYWDLI